MFAKLSWIVLILLSLASCGGGGSDESGQEGPSPSPSPAPMYDVSLVINGNGSLTTTASLKVSSGATIDFAVGVDMGWEVSSVTGCSGTLNETTYTTASITSNCAITANFVLQKFTVQISDTENGTVDFTSPQLIDFGDSVSFSVLPDLGFNIDSVEGCNGTLSDTTYTIASVQSNCSVTASFTAKEYTVQVTASAGGQISPNTSQLVAHGQVANFVVSPTSGYFVSSVSGCDGTLTNNMYSTSAITSDCAITAVFEQILFTVDTLVGENGNLSPSAPQSIASDESLDFSITADNGYVIDSITGCNGVLTELVYTTGEVTSDCTVSATFKPLVEHTVSFDIYANGTVEFNNEEVSDPQLVTSGETISLLVVPNDGFVVDSITGCDGTLTNLTYETAAITEDCTITAFFTPQPEYTVVPISSFGGSIFPNETQVVTENDTVEFQISSEEDEDFVLLEVSGCDGVLTGSTFTTAPVNEHCYVVVEFVQQALLHDTGITTCSSFDDDRNAELSTHLDNLDCAMQPVPSTPSQSGQDINGNIVPAGQDAHFGRDAVNRDSMLQKVGTGDAGFDFTRLNDDGSEYSGSGDYDTDPWTCVRDNHTGLIWQTKEPVNGTRRESEHDGDDLYFWHSFDTTANGLYADFGERYTVPNGVSPFCHAAIPLTRDSTCSTTDYTGRANTANLCGIDQWRLPSVNELHGLVNYGADQSTGSPVPLIDSDFFPNINTDRNYWTRMAVNEYPFATASAWSVSFASGTVERTSLGFNSVILVSDIESPSVPVDREDFDMQVAKAEAYGIYRNDFLPLAKHEKCINCHNFTLFNDVYKRHIREGRITESYRDSDCAACHTESSGFVDGWRAPLPGINNDNFLTSRASPEVVCQAMNRVRDPEHHLLEDHLILWAVEQFPELTKENWTALVESMIVEGTEKVFTCDQP